MPRCAKRREGKNILRTTPYAQRIRDDWGEERFAVKLQTDPTGKRCGDH